LIFQTGICTFALWVCVLRLQLEKVQLEARWWSGGGRTSSGHEER